MVPSWRGSVTDRGARLPAGVADGTDLWQRCSSRGNSCLDDALTDCLSVSKADRGTEKDDAGEKAETDGRAAAAEEVACAGGGGVD